MLTALELENFKGIAERQRVDFAPLTLLFGPNSAGKSTVLQALLYLHELLERGGADVDRTELGGGVVELGGFARLVHRPAMNGAIVDRAIVLRAEFTTPGGLERFGRDLADFPFPNLDDEVESAWLELTIRDRFTPGFNGPLVDRAVIGVGGTSDPLVEMRTGATLRDGEAVCVGVNLAHPLLASALDVSDELGHPLPGGAREAIDGWERIAMPRELLRLLSNVPRTPEGNTVDVSLPDAEEQRSITGISLFPKWGGWDFGDEHPWMVFAVSRSHFSALPSLGEPLRIIPNETDDVVEDAELQKRIVRQGYTNALQATLEELRMRERAVSQVRTFLEMIVLGTSAQLAESLKGALYIGPLRTIPPRGSLYERRGRVASWADGLAAWDLLLADRASVVERTNYWLKQVGAGCKVIVQQLFAEGEEYDSGEGAQGQTRQLLLDTGSVKYVFPSEVGAGVSQVIPIIVAALEKRAGLVLVEQPELHVHPAMQVGLGDLFIDAATRDGGRRTMLIETHSEHLILRLLRRIRETTANELDGAPAFSVEQLSVLYVENQPDGVRIRRLRVDENGEFTDPWPKGFFDERFPEIYGK